MCAELPNLGGDAVDMKPEGGVYILAHSETGHHHVIDREKVSVKEVSNAPEGLGILQMIVEEPTEITHLRDFDTHEPLMLGKGLWEVRLQREYTPEGYRRVAD